MQINASFQSYFQKYDRSRRYSASRSPGINVLITCKNREVRGQCFIPAQGLLLSNIILAIICCVPCSGTIPSFRQVPDLSGWFPVVTLRRLVILLAGEVTANGNSFMRNTAIFVGLMLCFISLSVLRRRLGENN